MTGQVGNTSAGKPLSKRYSTTWTLTDNNETPYSISNQTGYSAYDPAAQSYQEGSPTGAFEMDFLNNVDATTAQFVDLTLEYTNTVLVSDLKVSKAFGTEAEANDSLDDTEFTFKVYFTNIFGGGSERQVYEGKYQHYNDDDDDGTYAEEEKDTGTDGVITLKKGEYFIIKSVPVDTTYEVVEILPTGSVKWDVTKVEVLKGSDGTANADVTNSVDKTTTGQASVTGTIVATETSGDPIPAVANVDLKTGYLASYQAYVADPNRFTYTVTNDFDKAYLIIGKKVNHLYYNDRFADKSLTGTLDSDNTGGLLGLGMTVGGQTLGDGTTNSDDYNGYERATNAEQTFIFKIDEYDDPSSTTVSLTFYETLSFGVSDAVDTYKYRVIDADSSHKYVVTEITDWSWKYTGSATSALPTGNTTSDVTATVTVFGTVPFVTAIDANGTVTNNTAKDSANSAKVLFDNVKSDKRNVEGDTYIAENTATIPAA